MEDRPASIELRRVEPGDVDLIYRWRNDPFLVARSSSQRTVDWIEHVKWFEESLQSDHRIVMIVQKDRFPIGQVRFDRVDDRVCVISVYLCQEFTGRGYGVEAIRNGTEEILRLWDVEQVIACVRSDNAGGQSAFRKAGYVETKLDANCPAQHRTFSFWQDRGSGR